MGLELIADPHSDQAGRLATLQSLDILDTEAEAEFDEVVALASRICETPISLISLVAEDRQWFKARVGMADPETGLDKSICAHAILEDGFFEVEDTRNDPRTVSNPLVAGEPNLRFYAGAPLVAEDGLPMGMLCVLDDKPRKLTELQRDTLRVLARQVMRQIELKQALKQQETLRAEMDHRVKNSLQTIASFVRLYARGVSDPAAKPALEAIQRRIDATGALHEELQNSVTGSVVNIQTFLSRVCSHLQAAAGGQVVIVQSCEAFHLSHDQASAIGMIVSEFAANSLKHGFPEGAAGEIAIAIEKTVDGHQLICRDNGLGSNGAALVAPPSRIGGLGQSLMQAAAAQLGGELETTLSAGGSYLKVAF
ncbi:GAF domain-containing protein [Arenibacterium halophilum]|uniref:GAF domain-containing protein n=1 Tax=Arenibacterium halophilum TaxID=2583821 RepID=A0ABY2X743_9RHOB|nr:GAF domain-containing protein [Arenibacterium halophilum]